MVNIYSCVWGSGGAHTHTGKTRGRRRAELLSKNCQIAWVRFDLYMGSGYSMRKEQGIAILLITASLIGLGGLATSVVVSNPKSVSSTSSMVYTVTSTSSIVYEAVTTQSSYGGVVPFTVTTTVPWEAISTATETYMYWISNEGSTWFVTKTSTQFRPAYTATEANWSVVPRTTTWVSQAHTGLGANTWTTTQTSLVAYVYSGSEDVVIAAICLAILFTGIALLALRTKTKQRNRQTCGTEKPPLHSREGSAINSSA